MVMAMVPRTPATRPFPKYPAALPDQDSSQRTNGFSFITVPLFILTINDSTQIKNARTIPFSKTYGGPLFAFTKEKSEDGLLQN
jgi:hypothetical protein